MFSWNDDEETKTEVDVEGILAAPDLSQEDKSQKLAAAVFAAAQNGNHQCLKDIFGDPEAAALVNIDLQSEDMSTLGSTPLCLAACFGQDLACLELLRFGADLEIADKRGMTPLMWAVQNQDLQIVQRLLDAGGDLNARNHDGKSVLDLCARGTAVAALLQSRGYLGTEEDFYKTAEFKVENKEPELPRFEISLPEEILNNEPELKYQTFDGETFDYNECDLTDTTAALAVAPEDLPRFLDLVISECASMGGRKIQPSPSSALFLAARFYSRGNHPDALASLFSAIPRRVNTLLDANSDDFNCICYWLLCTGCLLHFLNQDHETCKATESYIPSIEGLLLSTQTRASILACRMLEPQLKPCILDYKSIPGLSPKYRAWRLFSQPEIEDPVEEFARPSAETLRKPAPRQLTTILSSILAAFDMYHVHPISTQYVFSQILYWLGARLFNAVLRTKQYLARAQAMQIMLNVSAIDDWCRNNDRLPGDGNDLVHTPSYKSMAALGRTHLSPVTQLLQWLQIWTTLPQESFDFNNVRAALSELDLLSPAQILFAAKHYRFEVSEPHFDKPYRNFLQHLPAPKRENDDRISIIAGKQPILAKELCMDAEMDLPARAPSSLELLEYFGGGLGDVDTSSNHYFVPQIPPELADAFEQLAKIDDVFDRHDLPKISMRRI